MVILLSPPGPKNADLIANLSVGTYEVYFKVRKASFNGLGEC